MTTPNLTPDAAFDGGLTAFRRDLHRHPETGWTEYRTTVKIIEALEELGLTPRYGRAIHQPEAMYGMPSKEALARCETRALEETGRADLIGAMRGGFTGCVAILEGSRPGRTVALRFDIDCNDMDESDSPEHRPAAEGFASGHPGLMHACGHDGHAAIGVGTARLLRRCRDQLAGRVVLLFQPAEEGLRGAHSMTRAGNLAGVDRLVGGHLGIRLNRLGTVAAGSHGFLASTKLDMTFRGRSAHAGACPELGANALAAAATAALNLLAIPRHSGGSSRINVGSLHAGTGRNVIPELAVMAIETRGATGAINEYMSGQALRVCRAAAEMHECAFESKFMGAAGAAVCDAALVERVCRVASDVEGISEVLEDIDFGGGEDITYMMAEVQRQGGQATEMMIGCPITAPHHNGRFDFDEAVLGLSARLFAHLALDLTRE